MEKELEIIKACQAGNYGGFGDLYEAYVKRIYDFVYYKTYHRETAEDLTSQIFMKALENIGSYRPGKGKFAAWLYGIARHAVADHFRRQRSQISVEDVWDLADDRDFETDFEAKDKLDEVKKYLAKSKSVQREIVIMRLWQGMSYREISEFVGTSEAGCKMTFSRVMSKLRAEFGPAAFLLLFFSNFKS